MGGIDDNIKYDEMHTYLSQFGKLKALKLIPKQGCAFACYHLRQAAEKAIECLFDDKCYIQGKKLKVLWARAQLEVTGKEEKQ